jgi:hypothetical protein
VIASAPETTEGRRESLLDGVLSLLARAEHVRAEAEDARSIPLEAHLEGGFVAASHLLHERVVTGKPEQAPASEPEVGEDGWDRLGAHGGSVLPSLADVDSGIGPITDTNALGLTRFARHS